MTVVQPRRVRAEFGWGEEEFEVILEEALNAGEDVIVTDITAPPGTGKTFYTTKYAVKHRRSMIASFPTHTNQEKALDYVLQHMEQERPRKLPMFVVDYGGLENYCLFLRPSLLMRLLDKFKDYDDQPYVEAVENFLNNRLMTVLLFQSPAGVDELWKEVASLLDYYKATGNIRVYRKRVRELLGLRSQREVCRSVCPIGLFFNQYRKLVRRDLKDPKVITWRKAFAEEARRKYPRVGRHIVVANPENFVENIDRLLDGDYNVEWVLCPRLLLISKATLNRRGRETFILARKAIVLTPHAGLDFVLDTVQYIHSLLEIEPRHILFVDEYDALLRPVEIPLYSLDDLRGLIRVAEEVLEHEIGDTIEGVEVDAYLLRYAEYVKEVAEKVLEVVEHGVEEKTYHPLANLFIEGAMSFLEEKTLRTRAPVEYMPLGPRPVHIKHFAGSDLLPKILNPTYHFRDLRASDPEWRVNLRVAKNGFSALATRRVTTKTIAFQRSSTLGVVARVRRVVVERRLDRVIDTMREYLAPLTYTPVFAVFYTAGERGVRLNSIDHKIFGLLRLRAVYTSATPVKWSYFVLGPVGVEIAESNYQRLAWDGINSMLLVEEEGVEEYMDRATTTYTVYYRKYREEYLAGLEQAIKRWEPVPPPQTTPVTAKIQQVSVRTAAMLEYGKLLHLHYARPLEPLYTPPPNPTREELIVAVEKINRKLRLYLALITSNSPGYTLVLVQNKMYARIIAEALKAVKCRGEVCGDSVRKITHYNAGRIDITWFRSRAERGIDLPHDYHMVVVVGSPYPRPSYVSSDAVDMEVLSTRVATANTFTIQAYNGGTRKATIAHTPRDLMQGIAELAQAIGRATRSAMRHGHPVLVIVPDFLRSKVQLYAPYWLATL